MMFGHWAARLSFIAVLFLAVTAEAQTFRAGANVELDGGEGPIFVAGGDVIIRGEINSGVVDQALFAIGGDVTVEGTINGGAALAGGDVTLSGVINGDAEMSGGDVIIERGGIVSGDLSAAGGDVVFEGRLIGDGEFIGGDVIVNGAVDGDLDLTGAEISIGAGAVISGAVTYRSPQPADIDPSAQITGEIKHLEVDEHELKHQNSGAVSRAFNGDGPGDLAFGALFGFVVLGASGALLHLLFPGWISATAIAGRENPLGVLAVGVILLLLTPVLAILSMLIIIGIPFGIFLFASYLGLLVISFIGAGFGFGHLCFDKSNEDRARLSLFAAGLAILLILNAAPFVGWVVGVLTLNYGLGALAMGLMRSLRSR